MKIFIDSADVDEIKQAYTWGVVDGVTTNPSLLKKAVDKRKEKGESLDIQSYLNELLQIAAGTPVSLEVTEVSAQGMIRQGEKLYELFNPVANNVNIKIPVNPSCAFDDDTHFEGIEAIQALADKNIPINCTLIFTPEQALLAAKAGATYLSPFAGRIDDDIRKGVGFEFNKTDYFPADGILQDDELANDNGIISGIDLVQQCVDIIERYDFNSDILAASLRNPRQVREAALVGAHVATLPFGVIKDMLKHHKTFEGMNAFIKDIVDEYADLTK